jgi:uncharacterized protein
MAKPVGAHCNLECSYCYYAATGANNQMNNENPRMSDRLQETYIRQYIEASPGPVISFTWHGGEPTLAGIDFYRRAITLQNHYLPKGWSCWNNLQTNGLLLNDEWCSFLAENHFDVGISIDGTEWLHDTFRKDHSGKGTYFRVIEAIRRLQAHGLQPDLLCTVNAQTAKEPILVYRALRELNTGWLQFIPIVRRSAEGQVTEDSVTGDEYGRFLCAVFDEWLTQDLGRLEIQQFAEMHLVLSGGAASLCTMAPTCGRVLIVEQDGGVYSCDHFVTPDYRIGEITTSSLAELVELPIQKQFGSNKKELLPSRCRACTWLSVCNGGCMKDRFILSENGESGLNYLCSGYRRFFAHACPPMKRLMDWQRMGYSYEMIKNKLREEELARWHNIGRNDPCPCGSGRKAKHCCLSNRI